MSLLVLVDGVGFGLRWAGLSEVVVLVGRRLSGEPGGRGLRRPVEGAGIEEGEVLFSFRELGFDVAMSGVAGRGN